MKGPISPEPVRRWGDDYLPSYLSNGLIGLRVGPAPPLGGIAVLNSFTGTDPLAEVESQVPIPYLLAGEVVVDGARMSAVPGAALLREQRYDFGCGQLRTTLGFTTRGVRVDIDVLTVCNRAFPTVVMQELTVRVDADCELELSAGLDANLLPGASYLADIGPSSRLAPADGVLGWRSPGGVSACGIAYLTELHGPDACRPSYLVTPQSRMMTTYAVSAKRGCVYRLRQLTSAVPDALHKAAHLHAARMLAQASGYGFDALLAENADRWAELWRGRVELCGAPSRWQAMADAAFFYLHTSVHRASPASTSPFGMAWAPDYHYYRGHVMWDIETFAVPALLLTQPDAARSLLRYRRSRLDGAQCNAASQGYAGAQFPWESAPLTGQEATPVGEQPPMTEHHVSMDVALAFAQYVHATGDKEFAHTIAWPVLAEVALWVASRVRRTARGYEIQRANGIAESGTPVNNNAYVNMAAATTLREANALRTALGLPGGGGWTQIADALVLPRNADGAILNHDGYRSDEPMGTTPEAAAGLFPVGYHVDPQTEQRTLAVAVDMVDSYVGAPMLSALLGVYAARLGRRDRALELYERGFADFIVPPHSLVAEFSPVVYPDQPRAAPFTANVGAFLTGCLYGLTGISLSSGDPATWCRRPVTLPRGWDAIHVDRVWVRGRPATLTATHGRDRAQLELL